MEKQRFVLYQRSNTQRVSVQVDEDGDMVLFSKDWRKSPIDAWIIGKGISIPTQEVIDLAQILVCDDPLELEKLLAQYESAKEVVFYDRSKNPNNGDN